MAQDLNGIDIYSCDYFCVESDKKLKFAKGRFSGKSPEDFKKIDEIKDVLRYCFWIIENKDISKLTKYAATYYLNRVMDRMSKLEKALKSTLRKEVAKRDDRLEKSIDNPGRTYV